MDEQGEDDRGGTIGGKFTWRGYGSIGAPQPGFSRKKPRSGKRASRRAARLRSGQRLEVDDRSLADGDLHAARWEKCGPYSYWSHGRDCERRTDKAQCPPYLLATYLPACCRACRGYSGCRQIAGRSAPRVFALVHQHIQTI